MKLISAISIALMAVSSLFGMKGLYGRLSATNDSAATESESISDFEKAIQIIKKYEGMHQPRHWPFVGYGHKVLRGETFSRTKTMTEAEAEALLRKDLLKNCAAFRRFGADSLLLGVLAYNIGSGATSRSSVVSKLKAGNRDIYENYIAHCRFRGKPHSQIQRRRIEEFKTLFVKDPETTAMQPQSRAHAFSSPQGNASLLTQGYSKSYSHNENRNRYFFTTNKMMACLQKYQQY